MQHNFVPTALALAIGATFSAQVLAEDFNLESVGEHEGRNHWTVTKNFDGQGGDLKFITQKGDGPGIVMQDRLTVSEGASITNVETLHVEGDRLNNKGTITVDKLTFGGTAKLVNDGAISASTLFSEWATSIDNNQTGILEVKDGNFVIGGGLNNDGTLISHTEVAVIKSGQHVTFKENGKVQGKNGEHISIKTELNDGLEFKNYSNDLEVLNFTTSNISNFATLKVHGDFTASGWYHSAENSSLIVDGTATIDTVQPWSQPGAKGSITAAKLISMTSLNAEWSSFKVGHFVTAKGGNAWLSNIKTLDVDKLTISEGGYASFLFQDSVENKEVVLDELELNNESNFQLRSDLTINGSISVTEQTSASISMHDGTGYIAKINALNVGENGNFTVRAAVGSKDHQITIDSASFENNASFTSFDRTENPENPNDDDDIGYGEQVSISIKDLNAEGNLSIDKTLQTKNAQIEIQNLYANGGKVKIDHELSGASSSLTLSEDASVALKGVNTDELNIELKTLAEGAVSIGSVADTTKTHVAVDGSLNNKEASKVIDAMNNALQLGEKEDDFVYVIGEGDLFGEINGKGDNYIQAENKKLTALGSVTALSALTLRHEMNSLSKRMGELRDAPAGVGVWVRGYGSEMEYGAQNIKSKNNSIQMGSDYTVGDWKVGAAFTYTDGESSYDNGSADNKGYGVAVYGTWFVPCGAYVDLMAKYNRLDNDFALNGMNGSYDANAYGVSAETGYRFNFMDGGVYVEPQLGIAYSRMTGETFTASNDVTVEQDDYDSLIGRVGVRTGFKFPKDKGTIYARVSGVYDFQGEVNGTATKGQAFNTIEEDLGGTWLEVGVGANFNWTKDTYTYIDFERTNGGEVKENYRWNVGVRHTF